MSKTRQNLISFILKDEKARNQIHSAITSIMSRGENFGELNRFLDFYPIVTDKPADFANTIIEKAKRGEFSDFILKKIKDLLSHLLTPEGRVQDDVLATFIKIANDEQERRQLPLFNVDEVKARLYKNNLSLTNILAEAALIALAGQYTEGFIQIGEDPKIVPKQKNEVANYRYLYDGLDEKFVRVEKISFSYIQEFLSYEFVKNPIANLSDASIKKLNEIIGKLETPQKLETTIFFALSEILNDISAKLKIHAANIKMAANDMIITNFLIINKQVDLIDLQVNKMIKEGVIGLNKRMIKEGAINIEDQDNSQPIAAMIENIYENLASITNIMNETAKNKKAFSFTFKSFFSLGQEKPTFNPKEIYAVITNLKFKLLREAIKAEASFDKQPLLERYDQLFVDKKQKEHQAIVDKILAASSDKEARDLYANAKEKFLEQTKELSPHYLVKYFSEITIHEENLKDLIDAIKDDALKDLLIDTHNIHSTHDDKHQKHEEQLNKAIKTFVDRTNDIREEIEESLEVTNPRKPTL